MHRRGSHNEWAAWLVIIVLLILVYLIGKVIPVP